MVLTGAAAAAAAAGGTLFEYNRKNFMYDRKMRQETEYQIMDFRIKQAELWREDVRDIVGLTSVKMDTYLIVNAVQLGFCVMAFCEGRLAAGTPVWLIGCHTLSLAGSFMYLLMSVWLAMHASVTAKSYEVRLLTQLVRLPVPSWSQLEGARTYSSGFEKVESKQMFRIPFAMGTQESVLQSSAPEQAGPSPVTAPDSSPGQSAAAQGAPRSGDGARAPSSAEADLEAGAGAGPRTGDVWGLEGRGDGLCELDGSLRSDPSKLRHLRLVREAMQYWQSYDGFARVALSCGTNQLVTALAYYVIGYVLISNHAVIACWLVVILFMVIAAALIRLDMSLTGLEYRISVLLVTSGPCLIAVAAEQWSHHTAVGYEVAHLLCPISYVVHAMWLMFLLYISNVREQKGGALLPTGFRSVMYIDVFGWIKRDQKQRSLRGALDQVLGTTPIAADASERATGNGPAVQALHYEQGQPMPSRPEELPGAAQGPQPLEGLRREDLEPTTFVPREKDGTDFSNLTLQAHMRPGFVPWRIFCVATGLLILLWWTSGVIMLLMACGFDWFRVAPLLREPEERTEHAVTLVQLSSPSLLSGGQEIPTSWSNARVLPQSLACSDLTGFPTLASSGRFGLYVAQLSGAESRAHFAAAPPCSPIEGEELQDLALDCRVVPTSACRALVLHHGGERLASCAVATAPADASDRPAARVTIADEAPRDSEHVTSLTLAGRCQGGDGHCAFAQTSKRRIMEMRRGSRDGDAGVPDWFPTRMLSTDAADDDTKSAGRLHLLGAHLGVFRQPQQLLEVVDPQSGALVGQWQLPSRQRWGAMCSMNNSLYFLAEGRSPQLWRFPVPKAVWAESQAGPTTVAVADPAVVPSGPQAARLLSRRTQAVLAAP